MASESAEIAGNHPRPEREWLRLMVGQLQAVLWTTDPELLITACEGRGLEAVGLTPEKLVGTTIFDCFGNDESHPANASHRSALNGVPAVVEVEYRTRVFQWSIDPLLGPNGDTIGCAGVAIDITERKQDEQRLRDSERRLAQQFNELEHIYRTAPVGLCLLDTNLRFVRINERLAAINGKPVKEHTGKTLHDIIPDIADVVEQIYNRVLETGEPVLDVEVHGKTASTGSDEGVWLVDYHPMFDRQGVISGVSSVVKDITELKRNEQQLIESEHQLAQQFDELALVYGTAPVGLCLLDAELKYVRINERLAAINGKPAEEHIGQQSATLSPKSAN